MRKFLLTFNYLVIYCFFFNFISCSVSHKTEKKNHSINELIQEPLSSTSELKINKKNEQKVSTDIKHLIFMGDQSVIKWRLKEIEGQNAQNLFSILPIMRFDNPWKQIYGFTGCNKFTAYFNKDNNDLFNITRFAVTELPCYTSNESMFINFLQEVDQLEEQDDTLYLFKDGNQTLIFEKYH